MLPCATPEKNYVKIQALIQYVDTTRFFSEATGVKPTQEIAGRKQLAWEVISSNGKLILECEKSGENEMLRRKRVSGAKSRGASSMGQL